MEIWKDIKGFEGLYQISNLGNIKALEKVTPTHNAHKTWKEKILKPIKQKSGYLHIGLWRNRKCKQSRVHRLVADAFCVNNDPLHKTQVNHINENKADNRACNLEWVTPKENTNYGTCLRRRAISRGTKVRCIDIKTNQTIKTFLTMADATRWLNKKDRSSKISLATKGKQKTAYGYKWEVVYE